MTIKITVTEAIDIPGSPCDVWDYTQDFSRRPDWDSSILSAEVIGTKPAPRVRIVGPGGLRCTFQYKRFDRPRRTSLAMVEVQSPFLAGGAGSWSYDAKGDGTRWKQTNTLIFKIGYLRWLVRRLLTIVLRYQTRRAMVRVQNKFEMRQPNQPFQPDRASPRR